MDKKKLTKQELLEIQADYIVRCLEETEEFATKNNVKRARVVK